jgi:hypothetical protein
MHVGMRPAFAFPAHTAERRLELRLRAEGGEDWVLSLAPGMERFIGAYSRLPGFDSGGPLLAFHPAGDD